MKMGIVTIKREPLLATREYWKSAWDNIILIRLGKTFITIKRGDK